MENKRIAPILAFAFCVSICSACIFTDRQDHSDGGTGTGTSRVQCEELSYTVAPLAEEGLSDLLKTWAENNSYGLNSFYLWSLDDAGAGGAQEYYFHSTGQPVLDWVPLKDWQIPTTDWSAVRWNLDGLDPYKFSQDDPFVAGYLPYVLSMISWKSKFGSTNDGSCYNTRNEDVGDINKNDDDTVIGDRFRCVGASQLDIQSPVLRRGQTYLLQMSMIAPLGADNGYKRNRVQSCYRKIVVW